MTGLTVKFRRQDALSHRDFMGSFLAQGVVRASLGDILAEEGRAVLFVKTELAPHFLSQIDKIGRVGVQITKGFTDPLPQADVYKRQVSPRGFGTLRRFEFPGDHGGAERFARVSQPHTNHGFGAHGGNSHIFAGEDDAA